PGPRLPLLKRWLMEEVWTSDRLQQSKGVPSEYLKSGERLVNEQESLLMAAADSYLEELVAARDIEKTTAAFLESNKDACVVILDGCSVREIPKVKELARISHRPIVKCGVGFSAIPSATEYFVSDRLGFGFPVLGPSQIVSNREWKDRGIRYYFLQSPNESQHITDEEGPILIWHRFPDLRFMDSTASSTEFYDGIWDTMDLVWQRTVQALPASRPVLVTSDHGYVFFGPGLSDRNLDRDDRPLKGKRYLEFAEGEPLPEEEPGLYIDRKRRLAVIKGRYHNRPQAPHPSQSLYRHGGLSLMEVLTPWILLSPMT
ncbi:MAG: hypothetical protein H6Q42_1229, partial [Deltaproteobacteria bacterium]|nr:hypothetical protein [Deltaproteobacteria bacterium]